METKSSINDIFHNNNHYKDEEETVSGSLARNELDSGDTTTTTTNDTINVGMDSITIISGNDVGSTTDISSQIVKEETNRNERDFSSRGIYKKPPKSEDFTDLPF